MPCCLCCLKAKSLSRPYAFPNPYTWLPGCLSKPQLPPYGCPQILTSAILVAEFVNVSSTFTRR